MRSLCLGAISLLCINGINGTTIDKHLNIESATTLAASSGKNIFIKYEADWCLPCQIMNESVFADQNVQDLLERDYIFITANFDQEEDKEWFLRYNVTSLPTMATIAFDGSLLDVSTEALTAKSFLEKYRLFDKSDHSTSLILHNKRMKDEQVKKVSSKEILRANITAHRNTQSENNYTVTVGAFAFKQNALNYQQELIKRFGEDVFIVEDHTNQLFRLNIGRYQNRADGKQLVRDLKKSEVDCYIRKL